MRQAVRIELRIRGAVQGVGFRPHVWRQARAHALTGHVHNDGDGVCVQAQGPAEDLARFEQELLRALPPLARVDGVERRELAARPETRFEIHDSPAARAPTTCIPVEAATCAACLAEVLDPADRRHNYAFTNCTDCGPRYTILRALPYDRRQTTMAGFALCLACQREYDDPGDRRFHAQPTACPVCGPRLQWLGPDLAPVATDDAIGSAAQALRAGAIVAVKGLGGYHLACRADDEAAVARLRQRKGRDARPFAVMVPDLASARRLAAVDDATAALLGSPACPIVLCPKLAADPLAPGVAPGCDAHGLLLPYTPLHHLLLRALADLPVPALVLTSANPDGEPMISDGDDLGARLSPLVEHALSHDRPVAQRADDSLLRPCARGPIALRLGRGLAPLELHLPVDSPPLLAVGAELKVTLAVARGTRAVLSPHVGALGSPASLEFFHRTREVLLQLAGMRPTHVVHDLHPDLLSTRWAVRHSGLKTLAVQHHRAHVAAVLVDNHRWEPCIGVAWDGFGLGDDGTTWGAEFFVGEPGALQHAGQLASCPQPGGDLVAREPWRAALCQVARFLGPAELDAVAGRLLDVDPQARAVLCAQLTSGAARGMASSMGRLFDAVAALVCGCRRNSFEAEAAMVLEAAAAGDVEDGYPLPVRDGTPCVLDPAPLLRAILDDTSAGVGARAIARRFHGAVARGLLDMCCVLRARSGLSLVALGGGSFQNRLLLERGAALLEGEGFTVLHARRLPPGDGGLSVGQLAIGAARLAAARREE